MDYEHNDDSPIDIQEIRCSLNERLSRVYAPIRVNGMQIVAESTFQAYRNAFTRSYLYRFAVRNAVQAIDNDSRLSSDQITPPIEEVDRCYFIRCKISF